MTPCRKSHYRYASCLSVCTLHVDSCMQEIIFNTIAKAWFQCTAGLTKELLQGVSAGPAYSNLLDYWATPSSCLTDLEFFIDPMEQQLQPAYLNQLTRLTRLALTGLEDLEDPDGLALQGGYPHYAFELPELKALELDNLWLEDVELQCPRLKLLRIEGSLMKKLSLEASLEDLHLGDCTPDLLHEGFPVVNLIGLTNLSLGGQYETDSEAALFRRLPLMTRLRALYLNISEFSLPADLPKSLRDLTLVFYRKERWDSSVIPLLQQLPEAERICIEIHVYPPAAVIGDLGLDHDLTPFLAMRSLRSLHLGNSQVWKASALRQLGELEAGVARSGKKLKLTY